MHSETFVRRDALAGLVGGLLFVPYALSKPAVTSRIVATGWHLPGLTADATSQLFHVLEAVPVVLMACGLVALVRGSTELRDGLGRAGVLVAFFGFGSMTVFHWLEHLGPSLTVATTMGPLNWFEGGYYAGWVTTNAGLFACGVALARSSRPSGPLARVLLAPLPVGLLVSATAIVTHVSTFATTHRLVAGVTWIVVGALLWLQWRPTLVDSGSTPAHWTRTDGGDSGDRTTERDADDRARH